MKTNLFLRVRSSLLVLCFTFLATTMAWGQGLEDFTSLPTNSPSSYNPRTWTGTDNVTWTAEGARTDQTIDGKAICWGNSGNRNVISPTYSGGMGTLTFDYVRAFTGTGDRSIEVYVNGNQIGSPINVSSTSNDVITYNEDINIPGDVVLEIRSTGSAQVKLDNISWTAFNTTDPLLSASENQLTNLDYIENEGPSASQSFEVSGMNLDPAAGNINVAAPTNFEVSLDDNTYADDVDIAYTDGEFTNQSVFVRLKSGLTENSYTGNITITGDAADSIMLALSGNVTPVISGGMETFDNSNAASSYSDGSFVGENGITWSYVESRDANGDANGSGIDLPALMLRRVSDNSKVTSESIPGGIGDFSVKLYKGFTGPGDRQVELFVNGVSQGTSEPFDDFNEHVFTVNGINISGNVYIEIRNITSSQIIIDDISWTDFGTSEPLLTTTSTSINGLDYIESNGPSASQSFEVSGVNLDPAAGNINVTAPTNFEVSLDDNTYADDVTIAYTDGEFTNQSVFVRLKSGLNANNYSGMISISGGGADVVELNLNGTVIEPFNLPYFNGLRNQEDWDEATSFGFELNAVDLASSAGGYVRLTEDDNIVTPPIDLSEYELLKTSFDLTTYGGDSGQEITVFISNNGVDYDELDTFIVPDSYQTFTQYIDLSSYNGNEGRIKYQKSAGGASIRFRDINLESFSADYIYINDAWSPQTPIGNATATDDILIVNGSAAFNGDVELNNLFIGNDATLEVENVLKVNGDIENDGSVVFKSTSVANTAQFDVFNGTISGNGSFTAERYFPANRAFRLIASPIDGESIYENWQENGNYQAAIGTHITGGTETDGFDQSGSNNPSLFTYDNTLEDQTGQAAWNAVANTNTTTIAAGTPYRLFIRGDRSIDLTSNDSPANETIIRTTGSLHTGDFSPNISAVGGNFSFIGNPYQAIVDATQLQFTGDINNNFMYVWDASVNDNGAYVTVDLSANSNDGSSSDANQFIQPGQAVFFRNNETFSTAPSVTFTESAKATSESLTTIFNQEDTNRLNIRLYAAEDHQNEEREIDAVSMRFSETFSNEVNDFDAAKLGNIDENLALFTDNNLLAIERREIPMHEEEMQLVVVNYRSDEYVLEFLIDELPENATLSVYDEYLDTTTEITSAENTYAYSVDQSISESTNPFRFKLMFDMETFSTETVQHQELSFYPNPVNQKASIHLPNNTANYEIAVFDILGNRLNIDLPNLEESRTQLDFSALSSGVYILKLYGEENQHQIKFIKN